MARKTHESTAPSPQWIGSASLERQAYNQTIAFRRTFRSKAKRGHIRITADCTYRLYVNNQWVQDGPPRAYPNHRLHDCIDLSPYLISGENQIEVIVRYFGVGTFQHLPEAAGMWAEICVGRMLISSDTTWDCSVLKEYIRNTPKISNQMEPMERVDAQLGKNRDWRPARIQQRKHGLSTPARTQALSQVWRKPQRDAQLRHIETKQTLQCVPVIELCYRERPGLNYYTSRPILLSANLELKRTRVWRLKGCDWRIFIDGEERHSDAIRLESGKHAITLIPKSLFGLEREILFPELIDRGVKWSNWQVQIIEDFLWEDNDRIWFWYPHPIASKLEQKWQRWIENHQAKWRSPQKIPPALGRVLNLSEKELFYPDIATTFALREEFQGKAKAYTNGNWIEASDGSVEICYDMGEQVCGYVEIVIECEAGTRIEGHGVEFIDPGSGAIQHTTPLNRNSFTYISHEGRNRFFSLKRRSGRYWFIQLHDFQGKARILKMRVLEATAPVKPVRSFKSNLQLDEQIWRISERTLQLCMEDTYTDCPLYEQTCWIGDARNEALYGFLAYGDTEVSRRSLELGAQSLDHYPIVAAQVPSSWDTLLPAWSFLWGIHAWEHYFLSGDTAFLREIWPAIQKNLKGALDDIDPKSGLYRSTYWNLFEWAPIARNSETLLHNSMLLVGALKAAANCARVLREADVAKQYTTLAEQLSDRLLSHWDDERNTFPDALKDQGEASNEACQHTSMLALIHGITRPELRPKMLRNLTQPPEWMTTIASPFALQFLFEALEKEGEHGAILKAMESNYAPMIKMGSTTVWEMFPDSMFDTGQFPTRSHCHAWASNPIWAYIRIVLGIRQTAPKGKRFTISPWVTGRTDASGTHPGALGRVDVSWQRKGRHVHIEITHPQKVKVEFLTNPSLKAYKVSVQKRTRN